MDRLTLASLRSEARLYADERTAGFLTDTSGSLDSLIHNKVRKVRSWVSGRMGGSSCWDLRESFTTSASSSYCLDTAGTETAITTHPPSQIRELTIHWGTQIKERLELVSEPEAEALRRMTWGQYTPKGAIQRGRYLEIVPTPTAGVSLTITYLPDYTELGTSDVLYAPEGFRECVALEVGIQIRGMQDEPTASLEAQRREAYQTLGQVIAMRAPAFGARVVDVHPELSGTDPDDLLPPA